MHCLSSLSKPTIDFQKSMLSGWIISRRIKAFTLLELLVTISIIGILSALLLPVLSRAKDKGQQAFCSNNLHQIAIAFQLYHQDYNDEFPAPGSKTEYGPQPEDWIWWQQDRDVNQSAIAPHLAGFNANVFTCPGDNQAKSRQGQGLIEDDPYRYSYSLTSYNLTRDNANLGMSTIITQIHEVYPFKSSQIMNPTAKIMLIEEDSKTINDPRWVPIENLQSSKKKYNLIASRHNAKGNVIFADTHAEAVKPQFGQDPTNSLPTL
jgi:prepilin-type N-terminal cleavage/methylation domain-containing protein/prepilin-type processing-associated H-X9-DG protein